MVGAIGYSLYNFGTKIVADKVINRVGEELENNKELELVKQSIISDPELRRFVQEGENINEDSLPFKTKEEAIKVIVSKLSLDEVQEIRSTVQDGVTAQEQQELLMKAERMLSLDELNALKVVFYKEISKE